MNGIGMEASGSEAGALDGMVSLAKPNTLGDRFLRAKILP
jgi:hypothetical protein